MEIQRLIGERSRRTFSKGTAHLSTFSTCNACYPSAHRKTSQMLWYFTVSKCLSEMQYCLGEAQAIGICLFQYKLSTLRFGGKLTDLISLVRQISRDGEVTEAELKSGGRRREINKACRVFCELSVVNLGYPGERVSRLLGVSTSAVVLASNSAQLSEVENHL